MSKSIVLFIQDILNSDKDLPKGLVPCMLNKEV